MDLGIIAAIAMLVLWAALTFIVNDAPGMTHALLTAGVTLWIWRVVKRGDRPDPKRGDRTDAGARGRDRH